MPPRIYDRIPPLPEFIFQWDGSAPIDRINARWVYRAPSPQTDPAQPTPLPDAVLEIFQSHDAGPADPTAADPDEPDDPDEPARNGHRNGQPYSPAATSEPALEKASAALIAAGWTLLDEYTNKDFQHYYFQPPPDQAWRPSRRLFILNDPYATAEPDPVDPDPG